MKSIYKVKILCLIAGLGFSTLVFSKEDADFDFSDSSEKGGSLFEDIPSVYSASKYEQKITKAPASISIITADEIKKWGYRTFGQILSSLRGFYNTQDRNNGYVGARGFGLPSDFNSRILLLIDGHRYNNNLFDAFDTTEGFPVDLDVIERVEVVRGPSSSLYGTSAVFGVINVITKRGRDLKGANIRYSYGTNDTSKVSASYGNRFSNGLETFVTGTFFDSKGYGSLYFPEFDNRLDFDNDRAGNNGLSIGNDGENTRKLMAKASYGDFSLHGLYVNRGKDIPTASFGGVFNNHSQKFVDQAAYAEFKYDHTFDNQLNVQSRVSYNNYRFTGDLPLQIPNTNSIFHNNNLFYGEWWRAEIEASKLMWDDHRISVGGQYQDNFHQNLINYDFTNNLDSRVSTYQWALFVQDDYTITDQLTLNAGLRYDYYSIFGSTVNPRVGLIYNPWDATTFKLLYGEAFRAPNQFELNYKIPNSLRDNPRLKPEKLDTIEFIVEHYFTRQLRAELNVFHTYLIDNIISTPTPTGAKNLNARDVESIGVETQVENTWGDGFQGRISYSWQNTVDEKTREPLSNSPEHMIKINLIAPLWEDKLFLGFETQFMSSRKILSKDANNKKGGRVDDYVISNLTLFSQNWVKGLELSAGLYNIFDERYFDPASADHFQNAIQQDGMQFRVKGSLDF